MKLQITSNFDEKLAELYSSKVTVNLDNTQSTNLDNTQSTINPNEFWNSMELVAINHKAMINFRIAR